MQTSNSKESKTKVVQDEPFDFLGYEIQRGKGIRLAKKTIDNLTTKLKASMKRGRRIDRVLREINPVLRGVYNYAAKFSSKKMWKQMSKIDFKVSTRLYKLYKEADMGQVRFTDIPKTTKYISVKTGCTWLVDKEYWDKRNLNNLSPRKKFLFRKQDGKCAHCQRRFTLNEDEILETHHLKPKGKGGKDTNKNVILIHALCHKEIHESEKGNNAKT